MTPEALRAAAEKLAHSLGINLYIRDGWIYQTGRGEHVRPPKTARSSASHRRFQIAAAARRLCSSLTWTGCWRTSTTTRSSWVIDPTSSPTTPIGMRPRPIKRHS
jgi:hypothetical protein